MSSGSSQDDEALERLVRAGRADPGPAQLRRLEDRFDTWLAESAAPASGNYQRMSLGRLGRWVPILGVTVALLGISLLELRTNDDALPRHEERRAIVAPQRVTMAEEPPRPIREHQPDITNVVPATSLAPRVASPPHTIEPAAMVADSTADAPPEPVAEVAPAPPEPTPRSTAGDTEASYLRRSRAALRADPSRALEMANAHPSRFPHGVLDQERELIAIDALVRLGRRDEAHLRGDAFRVRYPSSAHFGRVSALVGGAP